MSQSSSPVVQSTAYRLPETTGTAAYVAIVTIISSSGSPPVFLERTSYITTLNLSPRSSLILYADDILYFQTISSSDCFFKYCSTVGSPPCNSINSQKQEKAQYFSLKVCSKIGHQVTNHYFIDLI